MLFYMLVILQMESGLHSSVGGDLDVIIYDYLDVDIYFMGHFRYEKFCIWWCLYCQTISGTAVALYIQYYFIITLIVNLTLVVSKQYNNYCYYY